MVCGVHAGVWPQVVMEEHHFRHNNKQSESSTCGVHPASKTSEVLLLREVLLLCDNNAGHSALCATQRPSAYSPDIIIIISNKAVHQWLHCEHFIFHRQEE